MTISPPGVRIAMLRLKPALELVPVGDGSVYLLLDGYALPTLLERSRTFDELPAAVDIAAPELRGMLDDRQLAYFSDVRPGRQRRSSSATVTIVGVGGLGSTDYPLHDASPSSARAGRWSPPPPARRRASSARRSRWTSCTT